MYLKIEQLMNELQYQSCPFWILKQKQSQTSLENIQTCLATTRSPLLAYVYRIDSNKKKFFKMPYYRKIWIYPFRSHSLRKPYYLLMSSKYNLLVIKARKK